MSTTGVLPARLLTGVLVAVGLALAPGCGGDERSSPSATSTTAALGATSTSARTATTTTTEPRTVIEVVVLDGQPTGGARQVQLDVGELVTLRIEADVADEVHVHGYDLVGDVEPGRPAEIDFTADIPGQFEVELEGSGVLLVELTVT